jgi:hypothetical protein
MIGVVVQAEKVFEENSSQSRARIHAPVAGIKNRRCFGLNSHRKSPPVLSACSPSLGSELGAVGLVMIPVPFRDFVTRELIFVLFHDI